MKNILLILAVSIMVLVGGCKKEAPAPSGPSSNWVGTYSSGAISGLTMIQITSTGPNTLQIIFKVNQYSYLYTATTLKNVTISGNTATINETENIIEATDLGPYNFNGTLQLNGNSVALTTNAISVRVPVNTEYSPMNFSFNGAKVD